MPSSIRWTGGAKKVAQVRTYTFTGTWVVGETVTFTYGTRAFVCTLTSATIATFLPLLVTAYNALAAADYPEHAEQTAGGTSPALTLTADTPGKPFTCTVSTNSAAGLINGGATSTGTATVTSAGPNDVATAGNYSGGALPGNGDTVNIDPDVSDDLLYSLDALAAVTGLTINHTGTVKVGLPPTNTDGTAYPEYRPQYLQTAGGTWNVGAVSGSQALQGSPRVKADAGSVAATWNVYLTGQGQDSGLEAALLKGTSVSNVLNVSGQSTVGVAVFGGEVATLATLRVTGQGAAVRLGSGVTLTTAQNNGGTVEVNAAATTVNHGVAGGTTTINGAGAVTTITAAAGTVNLNSSGTLTNCTLYDAVLDLSGDSRAVAFSNAVKVYGQGDVFDPGLRVTGLAVNYYSRGFKMTRGALD